MGLISLQLVEQNSQGFLHRVHPQLNTSRWQTGSRDGRRTDVRQRWNDPAGSGESKKERRMNLIRGLVTCLLTTVFLPSIPLVQAQQTKNFPRVGMLLTASSTSERRSKSV
jgi:hypothetical protein